MASGWHQKLVPKDNLQHGDLHFIRNNRSAVLVIAIDLGTAYSGYAFSFSCDYDRDPTQVYMNSPWTPSSGALMSRKAPTCILFDKNQRFHSFGYEAEDYYCELAADMVHRGWYFFKRSKMALYRDKIPEDFVLHAENGCTMPALKVFAEIIRYLKNHCLDKMKIVYPGLIDPDAHFVLTVPAIWTKSAKEFMKAAAEEAGIESTQLSIVSEPEAALQWCQLICKELVFGSEGSTPAVTVPATKVMVINAGGKTTDVDVLERKTDGYFKEICETSGGVWGWTQVDLMFDQFFMEIFGYQLYRRFNMEYEEDFQDLHRQFDMKKREISPDSSDSIRVRVPLPLFDAYQEETGLSLNEAIRNCPFAGEIILNRDKLRISANIYKGFFAPCTFELGNHVKEALKQPAVQGTNIFLMIGSFSESPIVHGAVKKAITEVCPEGKVILPYEPDKCVLRGAVICGHCPISITSRVSNYTFGINVSPPFDKNKHPEDHKVCVNGVERCRDVFKKYILEGDDIQIEEVKAGLHCTLKPHQREMPLKIYASSRSNPKFVDDENSKLLGTMIVYLPDSDDTIEVKVRMMFIETGLAVEAEELLNHTKSRVIFGAL